VGVVVPVRDGVAHLADALQSVLEQVPPPDDVVVVDGGSTDGSAELARTFTGVRVVAQIGTGLGDARNQGAAEVAGELVAFCDADDRWPPGSLAARTEVLERDADAAAVVGQITTRALDREQVPALHAATLGVHRTGWTPGAVLVRRGTFEQVGPFAEHLGIGCDSDWLVRLTQSGLRIVRLEDEVLVKGVRPTSLSTDTSRYREELVQVAWDFVRRRRSAESDAESDAESEPESGVVGRGDPAPVRTLLHVVPRMIGGGPERGIVAQAAAAKADGRAQRHVAIVLEGPASMPLIMAARRAGVVLEVAPSDDRLDELVAEADVVLLHWWNHPRLRAVLQRSLPASRVVLWCHVLGLHPPQVLTADAVASVDQVLLTTELSRSCELSRAAEAVGVPVDVVPAPFDVQRLDGFSPTPHDGVRIGYVGLVNDTKLHAGFAQLCAAVAEAHPDTSFVVAGGGGGEERLRADFERLGLGDRAEVLGPTDDVRGVLEGLDVFVSPLVPDTYATAEATLQEAMWVGVPPVLFRHRGGAWPEVEHERTGLLVHTDEDLVDALVRLAGDVELRSRLGAAARAHARTAFDPGRRRAALQDVLDRVTALPRRSHPPLPGADDAAAAAFVRSLGEQAGPFAVSLAGSRDEAGSEEDVAAADDAIARSSPLLVQGDGGIVHSRNLAPEDPHLRWWSGLVAHAAGRVDVAAAEFEAAEALGLVDGRPARRRRAILDGAGGEDP
jgi:glycosyltransferase involved in cell wall biosynthesis